ncbi:MAG: hypothetical protein M0Z36_13655 [Thermaerobacter sp.]|nr:hypothetical protein [Thermaerobacter sp.]
MKLGTWLMVVALLGGMWVIVAPYIIGYGPKHGNPWAGGIVGVDVLAALVIVAALAGLAGFWRAVLHELGTKSEPFAED